MLTFVNSTSKDIVKHTSLCRYGSSSWDCVLLKVAPANEGTVSVVSGRSRGSPWEGGNRGWAGRTRELAWKPSVTSTSVHRSDPQENPLQGTVDSTASYCAVGPQTVLPASALSPQSPLQTRTESVIPAHPCAPPPGSAARVGPPVGLPRGPRATGSVGLCRRPSAAVCSLLHPSQRLPKRISCTSSPSWVPAALRT